MQNVTQALKVTTLAIILSFGISYVYAWTAPTATPPGGNVSAPINTSATAQYKEGAFGIGGLIRGYANAIFDGSVGVGVTIPQVPLHTAGSINAPSNSATPNGSIMLGGTGTGVQMAMGVTADVTPQYGWVQPRYANNSTNYNLVLNPNGGSVGVGVSSPTQKLDVAGNIKGTGVCIGTDCKTAWPAGGSTPPVGSEFLNTSATAQTKAGWLKSVGGNGGDLASRIGVGNNWWMSENTNGNYAIHRNGVGDKLTMDTNGNVGLVGGLTAATSLNTGGTVTAAGNIRGQHIKFSGEGVDSGAGADVYSIYQESGPWSYPYPDLRIQYHTGIKYDAYQGYGGHQFYTGWDGSGNPAGLQMQITDKVYVSNDVCTTEGKCLSAAGGVNASLGAAYWYHPGCGYGGPCQCPGNSVMVGTYGWWTSYTDAYYLCRDILN